MKDRLAPKEDYLTPKTREKLQYVCGAIEAHAACGNKNSEELANMVLPRLSDILYPQKSWLVKVAENIGKAFNEAISDNPIEETEDEK